MRQSNHY